MSPTKETIYNAIDREVERLIPLYDFSKDATVSLLSESENRVYLVRDPALPEWSRPKDDCFAIR